MRQLVILIVLVLFISFTPAFAQANDLIDATEVGDLETVKSLFERTAQIKFPDRKGQASGFFILDNALITNYHVVSSVVSSENKEVPFVVFKDGVEKKRNRRAYSGLSSCGYRFN